MGKLEEDIFVCVDCETTGLDPKSDRIIEIGAIRFRGKEILDRYETLVDPERDIPDASKEIHNISNEMVKGKPKIREVLSFVLEFIGTHILVGHGIGFDIDAIASSAERHEIPCKIRKNPILDTLRMARLYGECPTNSLQQLRKHFNVEQEDAHRAMGDVIVNIEVFRHLAERFRTTEQLFKALSRPIAMKIMPLGKHKGRLIKDIPLDYLLWAANKDFDQDLLYTLRSEIKRRKSGNLFSQASNPFHNL